MTYILNEKGYNYTENLQDAEICIVNTCGFINSAKEESIDTIFEISRLKEEGNLKYLVVAGCLSQRYPDELKNELHEVDAFVGTTSFQMIDSVIEGLKIGDKKSIILSANDEFNQSAKRDILTDSHYAYLKIAEGCDNRCTYCIIPKLRGKYRSLTKTEIINQAKELSSNGVKELILIAQDTSKYGSDLYGKNSLGEILKDLSKIDGIKWIRFLYTYPEDIDENLIDSVNSSEKILPYFDIPIQHANDRILKLMNRSTNKKELFSKIKMIRTKCKNAVIRTSLMVGFPSETDDEFTELLDFVQEVKFDRLGVFEYSREEDTPAYKLSHQIDEETKKRRAEIIMARQQKISEEKNEAIIGQRLEVIIDEVNEDHLVCRSYRDMIDVDGVIYINEKNPSSKYKVGDFIITEIIDAMEYDLIGEVRS